MSGEDPLEEVQAALESRSDIVGTKMFGKDCLAARGKVMVVLLEGETWFSSWRDRTTRER